LLTENLTAVRTVYSLQTTMSPGWWNDGWTDVS